MTLWHIVYAYGILYAFIEVPDTAIVGTDKAHEWFNTFEEAAARVAALGLTPVEGMVMPSESPLPLV